MNYSLDYKDIEENIGGANTGFEELIDTDVLAALGDILARAKVRCAARNTLACIFAT